MHRPEQSFGEERALRDQRHRRIGRAGWVERLLARGLRCGGIESGARGAERTARNVLAQRVASPMAAIASMRAQRARAIAGSRSADCAACSIASPSRYVPSEIASGRAEPPTNPTLARCTAPVGMPVAPSSTGTLIEAELRWADQARASTIDAMICAASRSRCAAVRGSRWTGPQKMRCAHGFGVGVGLAARAPASTSAASISGPGGRHASILRTRRRLAARE